MNSKILLDVSKIIDKKGKHKLKYKIKEEINLIKFYKFILFLKTLPFFDTIDVKIGKKIEITIIVDVYFNQTFFKICNRLKINTLQGIILSDILSDIEKMNIELTEANIDSVYYIFKYRNVFIEKEKIKDVFKNIYFFKDNKTLGDL